MTRLVPLALLLLVAVAPSRLGAQDLSALREGQRIRVDLLLAERSIVRRQYAQPVTGTLTAVRGDTLRIAVHPSAAAVHVPQSAVRALYVSRGRPGRLEGALRSAMLPAVLGGALGALSASVGSTTSARAPAEAALRRAVTAAVITGMIGAIAPRERWQRLPLPAHAER
jgi:hypothetical protein